MKRGFGFLAPAFFAVAALAVPRWEEMDYGPFLSSSVTMQYAKNGEDVPGVVMKGVTLSLKVDGKPIGAACFDTMLCRWAGVWTAPAEDQPALKLYGTPFDGTHRPPERSRPHAQGPLVFRTLARAGWLGPDGTLHDPRPEPYEPLPKDWAQWSGLHVSGDQVALGYTVQGTPVQELAEFKRKNGIEWFERTLEVGPSKKPLTFVVCDAIDPAPSLREEVAEFQEGDTATVALWDSPHGEDLILQWRLVDGAVCLEIPPLAQPAHIAVRVWHGPAQNQPDRGAWEEAAGVHAPLADFSSFTRGGPSRYPQTVTTQGKLGNKGGAYEVDTLTLPEENPWRAWMRPGGFDFFSDGKRAAVSTWSGDVWIVSGIDEKLDQLQWRRFATGLFQPLGLKIVDDEIYVLGRDQITRLHDLDGDGEADFYENFNNDISCTPNFHEFATDLNTDPAGNFYFSKCAPLLGAEKWDPVGADNGCFMRVTRDGSRAEIVATGLRASNGSAVGPLGELTCSDNEGIWTPVCRLNWIKQGMFLGAVGMHHRPETPTGYDPPLCWVPWSVDNSSGGQAWVTSNRWGPFEGELLLLSYGKSALFHVLREEAGGVMQGGVVKFPLQFMSGIMRARFNSNDGQLYVAGLRGWQTNGGRDGAFQRVRYTGQPFETVTGLRVQHDALKLTFNVALDPASVSDPGNFDVQQWNYRWTEKYGSDLYSVTNPAKVVGKKGELKGESVKITSAMLSPDGKTVTLAIPGLRPVMQMLTRAHLKTAAGHDFPVEICHTINVVP